MSWMEEGGERDELGHVLDILHLVTIFGQSLPELIIGYLYHQPLIILVPTLTPSLSHSTYMTNSTLFSPDTEF